MIDVIDKSHNLQLDGQEKVLISMRTVRPCDHKEHVKTYSTAHLAVRLTNTNFIASKAIGNSTPARVTLTRLTFA